MPNTYVALATQTLGTATSSVTLSLTGISGYTDLVLVTSVLGQSGGGAEYTEQLQFNADTSSGLYSDTLLRGDGSTVTSGRHSNQNQIYLSVLGSLSTTVPRVSVINIQNYANASVFKTVLSREAQANTGVEAAVGLWRNTNAITSIRYSLQAGNIAVGSTFSLYGIANADQGAAKATGGIITEDATYWYHTFGASSAFIPKQSLTCDVLVVAGGGGSGYGNNAGGGGGGGYLQGSMNFTAISYPVVIGAGGTTSYPSTGNGGQGNNTTFNSATALGGGAGSGTASINGSSGGSGGGGGYDGTSYGTGGASTQAASAGLTPFGNAGGSGGTIRSGGGAGTAGGIPQTVGVGSGKAWLNGVIYAQGGNTVTQGPGTPATLGTGNGGDQGSTGSSGIVIVRYLKA
jgi:hypothetical protein